MNLLMLGLTVSTLGKVILGVAVLRVHAGILREHKLDTTVFEAIRRERYVTMTGILLIIVGYILEVSFYSVSTELLTCSGEECAAAIGSILSQ